METLSEQERLQQAQSATGKNHFYNFCHIVLDSLEQDHAVLRLDIRPEHLNPYGMVHGGMLATLADNATGFAVHTDGRVYVTQSGTLHYLSNQGQGSIYADARVVRRGHATALVRVDILGDGKKLLATGDYTMFCVKQSWK